MENKIKDKININGELRLVWKESKNGSTYLACVLCVNGTERIIGFDKDYYTIRKIINGGNK